MAIKRQKVINLLEDLLAREYLQRDVYETYSYWLFGLSSPAIQNHLKDHMKEEMKHIEVLQRYLMYYKGAPMTKRMKIPNIEPDMVGILQYDLGLEVDAVERYTKAIQYLESDPEYTSLRVDLEDILVQEQEHVHDLYQWLETADED